MSLHQKKTFPISAKYETREEKMITIIKINEKLKTLLSMKETGINKMNTAKLKVKK